MSHRPDDDTIHRLLEVGRALVTELDPEAVLDRILEEAREITGARYAALGVLNERRTELERFLTVGIDHAMRRAIGSPPRGRGVLGVLIDDPRPLRLAEVGRHSQSYGFPPGHPPMHSFLGVPIVIRGEAWGNLYLSEKQRGGAFTEDDEEAAVILADWAATAIENARLYHNSETRRRQLERAVRGLEAARDIADAIGGVAELDQVLELVVKRGRALVHARSVLIMLRDGEELLVAASAGHAAGARGRRLSIAGSTSGRVLKRRRPERVMDVGSNLLIKPEEFGVLDARTALLVPMLYHGTAVGVLAAFDRGRAREAFSPADEQLLRTFAASAANAVALRRSVEQDRLRTAIVAADSERSRWARELHDETLQSLGGLRVLLASTLGRGDSWSRDQAIRQAIEDIDLELDNLRAIITDLRPSLLDDLGLLPAIESLLDRRRRAGLEIVSELSLPDPDDGPTGVSPELETTVYRLVQESLTNVVKHSRAKRVRVSVDLTDMDVFVEVHDDGIGFDTDAQTTGFGLVGMAERVYLAGGTLQLQSSDRGTVVSARLPVDAGEADKLSGADEAAL